MGTTTARLTVDEYLALPEEQIARTELIDGEIVPMSEARLIHEIVKARATRVIFAWQDSRPEFEVLTESRYRLAPRTASQPDVSVISAPADGEELNRVPVDAPLVAVEVVSSDDADRLENKVATLLALGTGEVWLLYPSRKRIYIHRINGIVRLDVGDTLISEALPGFSAPVSAFFRGLP